MKRTKARVWRTFLKLDGALKGDLPPECDSAYLVSKGIEPESPIVLGLIRDHVIPLHDTMPPGLEYFWFLVHNRESGVPTTEDDKASYLDITIVFSKAESFRPALPFVLTRPASIEDINKPSGWNHDVFKVHGSTMGMLDLQAMLVLQFIRMHKSTTSTFTLMKHYRQYMHYFANIGQMKIS